MSDQIQCVCPTCQGRGTIATVGDCPDCVWGHVPCGLLPEEQRLTWQEHRTQSVLAMMNADQPVERPQLATADALQQLDHEED